MIVSLIVAMAENRVIGRDNTIPWHIPEEQKLFRRYTLNHAVIMGRKTYESIGKPLEQRLNIVVSRNRDYLAPGCTVVNTLEDALAKGRDYSEELFVIGGEALFIHALPLCRRIYLTRILANVDGDTFFPEFDGSEFREIVHETFPGPLPYVFSLYERS